MRFQKGQSGNPKGRPKKGQAMTELLEKYLKKNLVQLEKMDKEKLPSKDVLVIDLILQAGRDGNLMANRHVMDRIDGKPTETLKGKFSGDMTYRVEKPDPEAFTS